MLGQHARLGLLWLCADACWATRGAAAVPYDCTAVVTEIYKAIFTRDVDPGGLDTT